MWRVAVFLLFLSQIAAAQSDALASLARKYLETGSRAARESLLRFAEEASNPAEASLARLALGIGDHHEKSYSSAAEQLALALERPNDFADYAVYYRALALAGTGNHSGAAWLLADFARRFPSSPLVETAQAERAESLSLSEHARQALELLSPAGQPREGAKTATPAELLLLAQVAERAAELARAVQIYQRIYYEFPTSAEQSQALAALNALRAKLGTKYPEAAPALRLTRADQLAAAQKYSTARAEYRTFALRLKGLAREQAQVRIGACDYHLRADLRAYRWLKALKLAQPEAAAERLYYLAACARRLKRPQEFVDLVAELGREHRQSAWHEEALFAAGNYFLVENDADQYQKYYRALFETFPKGRYATGVHWKLAWRAYLDRKSEARQLMEEHTRLYPSSTDVPAAIFWLGRLAEASEPAAARACYERLVACCPNYYYGILARDRLKKLGAPASGASQPSTVRLLAGIPASPAAPPTEASAEWNGYLRRARTLDRLGMADLAQRELRFRAESPQLSYLAGLELAQQAAQRGNFHQAIRYLKRYTPGYLSIPLESMPRPYWELLFPMPWRNEIESYSKLRDLDPYLVAALIRQESEFNPGAISKARARGLMQIMPSTGRRLGRNLGMRPVTVTNLYVPETSLKLGTLHLRRVLDQYEGRLEPALAGYNAGENRADKWLGWNSIQDPAEFVESIPFSETRGYIQIVLRNADVYRRLYGSPAGAADR